MRVAPESSGADGGRLLAAPRADPSERNYRTGFLPWVPTLNRASGNGCGRRVADSVRQAFQHVPGPASDWIPRGWRMQLAAEQICNSDLSLAAIVTVSPRPPSTRLQARSGNDVRPMAGRETGVSQIRPDDHRASMANRQRCGIRTSAVSSCRRRDRRERGGNSSSGANFRGHRILTSIFSVGI